VIKWGEFKDGNAVFEAFLPEHDRESSAWLLRSSRHGHVLEERRVRLTWPPRFGPDSGDVAKIEAELDASMARVAPLQPPATQGGYVPGPCDDVASEPHVLAVLAALLAEYVDAEKALGLTEEQSRTYLGLPHGTRADGLYPMAVTPKRDGQMRRMIALARVVERDSRMFPRKSDLLAAVLADDISCVRGIVSAQGVEREEDS
jgi:hypothetical protein